MNKKKKTTRIKHRKNKERMKKLLHASLLKAKPKKAVPTTTETVPEINVKTVKNESTKKPVAKKKAPKKTTAKKKPAKKMTPKKKPAKKTTAKKD